MANSLRKINNWMIGFVLFFCMSTIFSCTYDDDKSNAPQEEVTEGARKDLSDVVVGYSSPSLNAPFYVVLEKEVASNVKKNGMTYYSVDGRGDINNQIIGIEDLISRGVKVLIVNPLDPKALVPAINAAVKSGIAVFIVDSFIDSDADYVASVLADNQGNGSLLGEWYIDKTKSKSVRLAMVSGAAGNPVGLEKRMGFVRGAAERQLSSLGESNIDIVAQGWGNWTIGGGLEAAEDILVAHPDIDLIVAENDAMAMGALKAIDAVGKQGKVTVLGFDGQKDALKLIKEGDMNATAQNSPAELAKLAVEAAVKYLNGDKNRGKVIHTKAVLIDKNNVDKFYDPKALF